MNRHGWVIKLHEVNEVEDGDEWEIPSDVATVVTSVGDDLDRVLMTLFEGIQNETLEVQAYENDD